MQAWIVGIVAKLINSDTIASYVRGVAAPLVTLLFLWLGAKVPFIAVYLTPELNAGLVAMAVGLATGAWGHIAKVVSVPTPMETTKVVELAKADGVITPEVAAAIKEAVAPDTAKGTI